MRALPLYWQVICTRGRVRGAWSDHYPDTLPLAAARELHAAGQLDMREARGGLAIEIKASGRERSPLPPALPLQPAGRRAGAPMQHGGMP